MRSNIILAIPGVFCADDDRGSGSSHPPMFDASNRLNFVSWFMAFSAWVAWKLSDSATILDGTEPIPVPKDKHAPTEDESEKLKDWNKRNRKLYGAMAQAMPEHLRTSLYTTSLNDGLASLAYLRTNYDAANANDHVVQVARVAAHYIDPKLDMREDSLRLQFDSMHYGSFT